MNKKPQWKIDRPNYFYRVTQLVSFRNETYPVNAAPFIRDFSGDDLLECRSQAYRFCVDMVAEIENAAHFILDRCGTMHTNGKDATVSMAISLIEYYNEEDYNCYTLNSENPQVRRQSLEKEYRILAPICLDQSAA